ncbi:hypothetical protein ALC62_09541 [Cyphomyrmex costatus]|uniref:Uncharacterized protein n=1 Tax=Cyphomyrmex costatus TaxID=456900 RepID=A0A195CGR4_9HYME|nr:hypothetical protein ALC62_09541 [Cyphomyrmex costatus]
MYNYKFIEYKKYLSFSAIKYINSYFFEYCEHALRSAGLRVVNISITEAIATTDPKGDTINGRTTRKVTPATASDASTLARLPGGTRIASHEVTGPINGSVSPSHDNTTQIDLPC